MARWHYRRSTEKLIRFKEREIEYLRRYCVDLMERAPNSVRPKEVLLPAGWETRKTQKGRVYYVDHNTRTTQFDPPGGRKLIDLKKIFS